jgi:chromosomal replication initiation ATPase DnaA
MRTTEQILAELRELRERLGSEYEAARKQELDLQRQTTEVDEVIRAASEFYKVTETQIVGKCREAELVRARHAAMKYMREESQPMRTLEVIGQIFGGKDHTTVSYAVRMSCPDDLAQYEKFKQFARNRNESKGTCEETA